MMIYYVLHIPEEYMGFLICDASQEIHGNRKHGSRLGHNFATHNTKHGKGTRRLGLDGYQKQEGDTITQQKRIIYFLPFDL
jgi:hypothetical protein